MHFWIKFNWSKLDDEMPSSTLLFAQRHSHWDSYPTVRVPCTCLHLHTYGQWNDLQVRADTAPVAWVIKWNQEWKSDIHARELGRSRANLTAHWGRKGVVLASAPDYMTLQPWVWFMQSKQGSSSQRPLSPPNWCWWVPEHCCICNGPQMDEGVTQRQFFSGCTQTTVSEMKTLANAFQIFIKGEWSSIF